jgi:hypothetical protein
MAETQEQATGEETNPTKKRKRREEKGGEGKERR